jgi:hypothetical protein
MAARKRAFEKDVAGEWLEGSIALPHRPRPQQHSHDGIRISARIDSLDEPGQGWSRTAKREPTRRSLRVGVALICVPTGEYMGQVGNIGQFRRVPCSCGLLHAAANGCKLGAETLRRVTGRDHQRHELVEKLT